MTDKPTSTSHESRDIDVKRVVLATAVLLLAAGAAMGVCGLLLGGLDFVPSAANEPGDNEFPPPHLETAAATEEAAAYRKRQQNELATYGWVDRDAGVVRIPIERAMEALVREGLPETASNRTRLDMLRRQTERRNE